MEERNRARHPMLTSGLQIPAHIGVHIHVYYTHRNTHIIHAYHTHIPHTSIVFIMKFWGVEWPSHLVYKVSLWHLSRLGMFYAWKSVKWTLLWLVKDKTGQHHNVCKGQCPNSSGSRGQETSQAGPAHPGSDREVSASCHGPAILESLCSTR